MSSLTTHRFGRVEAFRSSTEAYVWRWTQNYRLFWLTWDNMGGIS